MQIKLQIVLTDEVAHTFQFTADYAREDRNQISTRITALQDAARRNTARSETEQTGPTALTDENDMDPLDKVLKSKVQGAKSTLAVKAVVYVVCSGKSPPRCSILP